MLHKDVNAFFKKYLNPLVEKGYSDSEIANAFELCKGDIIYWRKKLGIKSKHTKKRTLIKKTMCRLFNGEQPQECLTDKQLHKYFIEKGIKTSKGTVQYCRVKLGIPPSKRTKNELTRQYLYFKSSKGRIIWGINKHYHRA